MSETVRLIELQKATIERLAERQAEEIVREALQTGGGGGTSGGMEARVAKLEAQVESILAGVSELKGGQSSLRDTASDAKAMLAAMDERIKALPTKDDVTKTLKDWLLIIGGVVAAINVAGLIIVRLLPS